MTTSALPRYDVESMTPDEIRPALDAAAALKDPQERVRVSAELAHLVQDRADMLRRERDQAATALETVHGYRPVQVYKPMGLTRTLYWKAKDRSQRESRVMNPRYAADEQAAWDTINSLNGVVEQWDALATDACRVRDKGIGELFDGDWPNVLVAKLTMLTSARVAQMRKKHNRSASA